MKKKHPVFKFTNIGDVKHINWYFTTIVRDAISALVVFSTYELEGQPGRIIISINFDKGDQVYAYFFFGKGETNEIEVDGLNGPLIYTLNQIESFLYALSDGESISEQIPTSITIYLG